MAIELFDPQLVIARLADQVSTLREIGGAADFEAAVENVPRQLPAAFVIDLSMTPGPNRDGTGGLSQHTVYRFAVILVLQNLRDARGEAAKADLRTMRASVMTALLDWPPAADFDPIEAGPGRLLQFRDLTLWWQDDYTTRNLLRI